MLTQHGEQRTKFVYVITNEMNGKKYVGSAFSPYWRFKSHISALKHHRHKVEMFQSDFDFFGEKAFTYTVIGIVTRGGAENEESKWMEVLRTYDEQFGYNYKDYCMNPIRKKHSLSYKVSPIKGKKIKH